jgi:DNA uptake protein ComE-like DNA-binding protein
MRFRVVAIVWFGMSSALAVSSASAQALPEGAGRETVVKVCGTCHPPERGASVRLTRDGWQDVITRMVGLGLKASDEDLATALEYLSTQFKGEAAAPLNLNKATSQQLESVGGLLRRESAALIAHRTKAGPCKTLDDLKGVAGLDFSKIEKRRDRLVCF